MLNIFFSIFIYLLAFYGVIVLVITVANSIRVRASDSSPNIKLALLVKDGEDKIEGVIRGILDGDWPGRLMINEKLTVLDMGSKDETLRILEKLAGEYGELVVLEEAQKDKLIEE